MWKDLLRLPRRIEALERRLEEITGYFAARAHARHYTPNAYLGDHTALALLQGRLMMFVDTRGVDIAPHLLLNGTWEPECLALFERLVRPGDTVLDIGAHLGVYALVGTLAAGPSGRVHAFEPNPRLAGLLTRSVLVNGFDGRARVHGLAVGEAEGSAELVFTWEWSGGGHLGGPARGHEVAACRVVALDELFPDPAFRADVIKMDVEGNEGRAVRGMRGLLARSPRVRMIMEFAPAMMRARGVNGSQTLDMLASLGFRFWNIEPDGSLAEADVAVLADLVDGVRNILVAREVP